MFLVGKVYDMEKLVESLVERNNFTRVFIDSKYKPPRDRHPMLKEVKYQVVAEYKTGTINRFLFSPASELVAIEFDYTRRRNRK